MSKAPEMRPTLELERPIGSGRYIPVGTLEDLEPAPLASFRDPDSITVRVRPVRFRPSSRVLAQIFRKGKPRAWRFRVADDALIHAFSFEGLLDSVAFDSPRGHGRASVLPLGLIGYGMRKRPTRKPRPA